MLAMQYTGANNSKPSRIAADGAVSRSLIQYQYSNGSDTRSEKHRNQWNNHPAAP